MVPDPGLYDNTCSSLHQLMPVGAEPQPPAPHLPTPPAFSVPLRTRTSRPRRRLFPRISRPARALERAGFDFESTSLTLPPLPTSPAKSATSPATSAPSRTYKSLPASSSLVFRTRRALPCLLSRSRRLLLVPPLAAAFGREPPPLESPPRQTAAAVSFAAARAFPAAASRRRNPTGAPLPSRAGCRRRPSVPPRRRSSPLVSSHAGRRHRLGEESPFLLPFLSPRERRRPPRVRRRLRLPPPPSRRPPPSPRAAGHRRRSCAVVASPWPAGLSRAEHVAAHSLPLEPLPVGPACQPPPLPPLVPLISGARLSAPPPPLADVSPGLYCAIN
ncbi:extensin-like [Oryza sativa Japonica Group]|uniref:extensin-like n=1 Tax=Oryza sativa subsp. japonica TaxID=39947 RepID=UPI00339CA3E8